MGCFNTINIDCPNCGKTHHFQSKSGSCELQTWSISAMPPEDISGIVGDTVVCSVCHVIYGVPSVRDNCLQDFSQYVKVEEVEEEEEKPWDMSVKMLQALYFDKYPHKDNKSVEAQFTLLRHDFDEMQNCHLKADVVVYMRRIDYRKKVIYKLIMGSKG
jgi:hypothetical protein